MDIQITVETIFENGGKRTHHLGCISRPANDIQSEGFGLLLEDAKIILGKLQKAILYDQIDEFSEARRNCPRCGELRAIHDYRPRVLDTLFGKFRVSAPRILRCGCNVESGAVSRGPLSLLTQFFPGRETPELRHLQADLGSRHSFREAARIMQMFLPCAPQMNTTARNRLGKVAREMIDRVPIGTAVDGDEASPPLTVFLDGAHIRCRPEYQRRHLDVVVGKVESPDMCRRFGLVAQAALSPGKQLRDDLFAVGWDGQRPITVISDGEPALPNLVRSAVQGSVRHILDWWHISMRVQHVENAVKGLLQAENFLGMPELFKHPSETLQWCLWHGKIMTTGTRLQCLMIDCSRLSTKDVEVREAAARVRARCRDLYSYLANNRSALTNYGWRYRNGLPISSSRAEGCVDDIGNTRMGKRQRMRWSPKGAHQVAVTRAAVLDGRLTVPHRTLAA